MELFKSISRIAAIIAILLWCTVDAHAQDITLDAQDMSIYFGKPKSAVIYNAQGTRTLRFDTQGRIVSNSMGNMRIAYAWDADGKQVEMTMYQGPNVQGGGTVTVYERSRKRHHYNVEGVDFVSTFKANGAMVATSISTPQMTITKTFIYASASDVFPSNVEMSNGSQTMNCSMTVTKTDSHGNAVEYTETMFGNSMTTTVSIEYYE